MNPPTVSFGPVAIGAASGTQTVTLSNQGTATLTLGSPAVAIQGTDMGDFEIVAPSGCVNGGTLPAGTSCDVTVRFAPKVANPTPGNRAANLAFTTTNNNGSNTLIVALNGQATAQPVQAALAQIAPASLSFGPAPIGGATPTQTVHVTNVGDANLTFGGTPFGISGADAGDFEVVGTSSCAANGSLAPNASCDITVRFAPKAANPAPGNRAAVLNLTFTNNSGGNNQQVPLNGQALAGPAAIATVAPLALSFGQVPIGGASTTQTVRVTNTGTANLTLGATPYALAGQDAADFQIVNTSSCAANGTIAPNVFCDIIVRFAPTVANPTPGNRAATLTVTFTNAANGNTKVVSLDGQAISGGGAIINPRSLDFGTARIGGASAAQPVVVRNGGTTPLTFGPTAAVITGTDTGDFQIVDLGGCTDGATLQPDATCRLFVRFAPSTTNQTPGNRAAALRFTFTNNPGGNTQDVALSGIATQAPTPIAQIAPTSLDFGTVQITKASAAQTVTITNIGDANLTFGATPFGISGADAADFQIVGTSSCPAGGSLAPAAHCDIVVRFAPTAANQNAGNRAAVLNITFTNNGGGNNQVVPLSGIATQQPTPVASISPLALTFGTVQITKASDVQTVTVTNIGDAPLVFGATPYTITGPDTGDFDIVGTPTCAANGSLAAGASCQVTLRFAPKSVNPTPGNRAAALTFNFATNGGGNAQQVTLGGVATQQPTPVAQIAPRAIDFGTVQITKASDQRQIVVTNIGDAPLTFGATAAVITGTDAVDFQIVDPGGCTDGATLQPGAICRLFVRFAPSGANQAAGNRAAALRFTFTNNGGGNTQDVALSGVATQQPTPVASISPAALTFEATPIGRTSNSQTVHITNIGDAPLVFGATPYAITGTDAGDFEIVGTSSCAANGSLAPPTGACDIVVRFAPKTTNLTLGNRAAVLNITFTNNGGGNTQLVPLSGQATAPLNGQLGLSASSLDFGNRAVGTSETRIVRATNTGTAPLTISNVVVANTAGSGFSETGDLCQGVTLQNQGDYCEVGVTFAPNAIGSYLGTLSFTDNASGVTTTQSINLAGQGVSSTVRFVPTPLDFGTVPVSSQAVQAVRFINDGPGDVTITNVGGLAAPFTLVSDSCTLPINLAPGSGCTFTVRFAPTVIGAFADAIDVTLAGGTTVSGAVFGTGTAAPVPAVSFDPGTLDFGYVQIGTRTAGLPLKITNSGTAPLHIGAVGVTFGGPAFAESADGCEGHTFQPGDSCTVYVTFGPTATGFQTGTLTVNDDAGRTDGNTVSTQTISLTGTGVSPSFTITPTSLDFGTQQVGTTSAEKTVTLKNGTGGALQIVSAQVLDGGNAGGVQFVKGGDNCSNKTIAGGASCDIAVQFRPIASGSQTNVLRITYVNDGAQQVTIDVLLSGIGVTARFTLDPTALNFGEQQIYTFSPIQTITLKNGPDGPLTIGNITVGGTSRFKITGNNCSGETIAANASCTIGVQFQPDVPGPLNDTLTITTIEQLGNAQVKTTVNLAGVGTSPSARVTPSTIDFGAVTIGTTSASQEITLRNTGPGQLAVIGATGGVVSSAPFAEGTDACAGKTLGVGESCTATVTFSPTTGGDFFGTYTLTTSAGTFVVNLRGQGVSRTLTVNPAALDFGDQQVGTPSGLRRVTVTNSSDSTVTISGTTLSGGAGSQFRLLANECQPNTTLAPTQSCTIAVQFLPSAVGTQNETLTITSNAPGAPGTLTVGLTGRGVAPAIRVTPTSHDFGNVQVGTPSGTQDFEVRDVGDGPARITAVALSGGAGSQFQIVGNDCVPAGSTGTDLGIDQFCTVTVRFAPTSGGQKSETLNITSNAPTAGSVVSVGLTGVGISANFTLSAQGLDFGNVQVGTTTGPQTITLTNGPDGPLTIVSATVGGVPAQFLVGPDSCSGKTIASGASCDIAVRFKPTAAGARDDTLTITYNTGAGAGTATITVPLTGVGITPAIGISANSLDFGNVQIGSTSATQVVTATNGPAGPLTFANAQILATQDGAEFAITGDLCSGQTIAANTPCTIGVQFKPAAPGGTKNATLRLRYANAQGGFVNVDIALTGVAVTARLTVSPSSLTFGPRQVGIASQPQRVTVTNTGGGPVTIASTGTGTGTPFSVVNDLCTGQILGTTNTICTVDVIFNAAVAGTYSGTLTITSNAPAANTQTTVSLVGTATNATLGISAPSLDFGAVQVGTTSAQQTIVLRNNGGGPLLLTSGPTLTGANAGDFAIAGDCAGVTLQNNGDTCAIVVTFRPTAAGPRTATISVTDGATNSPQTIALRGTGIDPTFSLSDTSVDFGDVQVGQVSATKTITITNTTGGSLQFGTASADPAARFIITGDQCSNKEIGPGATCTIGVYFAPNAAGLRTGTLTIAYDNGAGKLVALGVALRGNGIDPAQAVSPLALDFGNVQVGTTSATLPVTVRNTGSGPLTFSAAIPAGTDANQFEVVNNGCGTATVPAGQTCTIGVRFKPTSGGPKSATLNITSSAGTSVQTVGLSGTGISAGFALSPASLDFGNVQVGVSSAPKTLTITNNSGGSLTLGTPVIFAGGSDYATSGGNCAAGTIAAGAICTINVIFTPSAAGVRPGTLRIPYSNGQATVTLDVALTGVGITGGLTIAPSALTFGNQDLGTTSASRRITITNTGGGPVRITAVTPGGANPNDFIISGQNCVGTLPGQTGTCTLDVSFRPTASGARTATITVTSDANGSPQTIALSGNGVAPPNPALVLSAPSLTFGEQQLFTTSPTQTLTISNGGGGSLTVTSVSLDGANVGDFILTGQVCAGQQLGGTTNACDFGVLFRPTAVGARTADIVIVTSVGTTRVTVSGTGISPAIGISDPSLDFGTQVVGTRSAAKPVTLTNNGGGSLAITSVTITEANAGDFILGGDTCGGRTIGQGATCGFTVAFQPSGTGPRTATVTIADSSGAGTRTILLSGQGITGGITVEPISLQFGNVQIGSPSQPKTVTITNPSSTATLTLGAVTVSGANAGDFAKGPDACANQTLAPSASCEITIVFTPSAGGQRSAVLTVNTASGAAQTISLTGAGITPGVSFSTTSLNFGGQPLGSQSETRIVTFTNNGPDTVTITTAGVTGSAQNDFILYGNTCASPTGMSGATLPAGGSCQIGVAFKPSATGNRFASLQIADSAAGSPHSIELLGVGTTGSIGFSTPGLNFGDVQVGTTTGYQSIVITNKSALGLTLAVNLTGSYQSDYALGLNDCNATLAPNDTCQVYVRFTPGAVGARPAALLFTTGGGATYQIGLNGNGISGQVTFSPQSLSFGPQPLTTTSAFLPVTLTNGGNGNVTVTGVTIVGTNPGDFILAGGEACVGTFIPGGQCTVAVAFRPTATGNRFATLSFATNVGGGTQTVALIGTGTNTPAPVVVVSPGGLTFGPQQLGTASDIQKITVTNQGTAPLTLGALTLGGNAADFAVGPNSCAGGTVEINTSCEISVRFTPQTAGTRIATLSFTTNAGGGTQSISLVGTGTTASIDFTAVSLAFGQQQLNTTSAAKTVTLTNTGAGTLTITSVTIGGVNADDFSKVGETCAGATLAPGKTCILGASFTPRGLGNRSAELLINSNAPGAPNRITLTGEGIATPTAAVQLSALSLDFGNSQVGQASTTQTLTITNKGSGSLTITAVTLGGSNAGDFQLTGPTCSGAVLAPNGTCSVGVIFRPTTTGARQASILMIDSAAGSPREVILTGVGVTGAVGLDTASLNFGTQPVGTQSAPQILVVRNTGLGALQLGPVVVGGAMANNWLLLANTCNGATIPVNGTCQIGVSFKPTAEGSRDATIEIYDTAAGSAHVIALRGTGVPPRPRYTVTITTTAIGGTAVVSTPSPYGNGRYDAGTEVTLQASPAPNYIFIGWKLNGTPVGWANPLTVTVDKDYAVEAQFVPRLNFADTSGSPYLTAIIELSSRGIIRGYGDGNFGPRDNTLRAQMAALIARAMNWDLEDHGNGFTDQNGVDGDLWRNVGTLAFYGVARGYRDGTYDPTGKVLYAQVISFITRAMVAKGYWEMQEDNAGYYPNVPPDSGHRQDITTYVHYVGAVPGTAQLNGPFPNWDQPSTREWFAEALWRALNSYFGVDRVP